MEADRPIILRTGPLHYAPRTELGVVFLFAHVARRLGFRVEDIRPQYPDCIAYRRTGSGEKRVRIEFELRSSAFRSHGHDPRRCDAIVCWTHDWPETPARLQIYELRAEFDQGRDIWLQPAIKSQWDNLDQVRMEWAVSKTAKPGDVLLMYKGTPLSAITDIYILGKGPLRPGPAGWRKGEAYLATISRFCHLPSPISLTYLQSHRSLRTAAFVRGNMQGNHCVTEHWSELYKSIVNHNRTLRPKLARIRPEKISAA